VKDDTKKIGPIKNTYLKLFPFLLSHHPYCSFFDSDVITMGKWRVCVGCTSSYPLAVCLVISFILFRWDGFFSTYFLHKELLLALGVISGLVQLVSTLGIVKNKAFKILIKVLLGVGFGFTTVWILTLPIWIPLRLSIFISCVVLTLFIGSMRIRNLRMSCSNCIYHGNWDVCYGFRFFNDYQYYRRKKGKKLLALMFDRTKKYPYAVPSSHVTGMWQENEPDLIDPCRWLYHHESLNIPWVPRTGLEVERKDDIKCH
jgi:hypothetical protein